MGIPLPLAASAGLTRSRLRQLWYMPLLASAMGLMLVRLLVAARLLDVPGFAIYSGALLVSSTFCMLACLGLQPMLQRDLPVMLVRRRERSGAVLLAQCALVAAGCAAAAAIAVAGGATLAGLTPAVMIVGVVHGLSQQLFLIATVESRSRGEPLRFARQNLERSVAVLAAGAWAAAGTGSAAWALSSEAAVSLAMAVWLLRSQLRVGPLKAASTLRIAVRRLPSVRWRTAAALLAVACVAFVLINVDRWVAAERLPATAFAQYAFAWTLLMVAQSLQAVINASLYPLLARRLASDGRARSYRIAAIASFGLLATGALLALPVWLLLDLAVARWFPAYDAARPLLPVFVAIAVLRLSDFWSSFLVICGREAHLLSISLAVGLAALAFWWVADARGSSTLDAGDVAWLAMLLTGSNYLCVAVAARRAAKG